MEAPNDGRLAAGGEPLDLKELAERLELGEITIHDAVRLIGATGSASSAELHALIAEHPGPYVRLFAACGTSLAVGELPSSRDLMTF